MNDADITASLRSTLHSHSNDAPHSADLLERVKTKSRNRTILGRIGAGASALAVTSVVALLAGGTLQPAGGGDPNPAPTGDGVRVCFEVVDEEPRRLLVAATESGEVVNSDEANWRGGKSEAVETPMGRGGNRLALRVSDDLRLIPIGPETEEPVKINGQPGRLGDEADHDDSGERILAFETDTVVLGVEAVLWIQVSVGQPTDAQLIAWAESVEFHNEAKACEAGTDD